MRQQSLFSRGKFLRANFRLSGLFHPSTRRPTLPPSLPFSLSSTGAEQILFITQSLSLPLSPSLCSHRKEEGERESSFVFIIRLRASPTAFASSANPPSLRTMHEWHSFLQSREVHSVIVRCCHAKRRPTSTKENRSQNGGLRDGQAIPATAQISAADAASFRKAHIMKSATRRYSYCLCFPPHSRRDNNTQSCDL